MGIFFCSPCNDTQDDNTQKYYQTNQQSFWWTMVVTNEHKPKNKECSICLEEFYIGSVIAITPCLHSFHQTCLSDWMAKSIKCPNCMNPING